MHVKPLHDFDLGYINYVSRHAQKNWKDMRARNDNLLFGLQWLVAGADLLCCWLAGVDLAREKTLLLDSLQLN